MLLSERASELPLILAGPLLRKVTKSQVSVWVALKSARMVTLKMWGSAAAQLGSGQQATVGIGKNLHIVCVTAEVAPSLPPGGLFHYSLEFDTGQTFASPGVLTKNGGTAALDVITYQDTERPLPSFVVPPNDVARIRVVQGSCRKPHGPDLDALRTLDELLKHDATNPLGRPQQLFLTGDQIYADDVPDALLYLLADAGEYLLNHTNGEVLPAVNVGVHHESLWPGRRQQVLDSVARFTSRSVRQSIAAFYAAERW